MLLLWRPSTNYRSFRSALHLFVAGAGIVHGQDTFEIHVYEFESLKRGRFTLEQHINYVGRGTKTAENLLAPTNNQLHITFELTAGVSDNFSIGAMQLNAVRPGGSGLEYAGWRLLPHFYAPKSWHLPFELGLVTEFSFQKTAFEENARRIEIRPILERSFGRVQLDLNPVFERAVHGPGIRDGWNFEPAFRIAYAAHKHITPSIEYYSSAGALPSFLPLKQQVHLFFPGADFKLSDNLVWSLGLGLAATPAGSRLIYKSRIEIEFGRRD